ncbi:hypothetical protein CgunFtcFv8_006777 [Champsocephalus gunnari]|nr:hypothetical protein CgunFtcFv8_006777 [Champsocephalus gunnari]
MYSHTGRPERCRHIGPAPCCPAGGGLRLLRTPTETIRITAAPATLWTRRSLRRASTDPLWSDCRPTCAEIQIFHSHLRTVNASREM